MRTTRPKRLTRRRLLAGAVAAVFTPTIGARAQATVIRWGESLPATHPQVQMAERIAKEAKEKSGGRIDIQVFPNSQLGSNNDMIESVSSGALTMTTDGAGAIANYLPQLSIVEAPYLWRDAAHLAKLAAAPIFATLNNGLVSKRGMRLLAVTYYGKRHLTSGTKAVRTPADMVGFKLRVPPVDTFRAMAEAWGAKATPITFGELYLALSQNAVDGQENPLPTINSAKLYEVQKYLILTQHIITPRMPMVNEKFWTSLAAADRDMLQAAIKGGVKWQDQELLAQETTLTGGLKERGMSVIEPDVEAFRKPVLATLPQKFADKWGKGSWDIIAAL
ncbi:MAG: sialic acid TRAP transporter substrate-binding protein SiaP [Alphaproteobacteria bacterium]|nr:sialic acid TRAP transporter substrate-binding protein SiaP [Alphaproteobacteria bacterium]